MPAVAAIRATPLSKGTRAVRIKMPESSIPGARAANPSSSTSGAAATSQIDRLLDAGPSWDACVCHQRANVSYRSRELLAQPAGEFLRQKSLGEVTSDQRAARTPRDMDEQHHELRIVREADGGVGFEQMLRASLSSVSKHLTFVCTAPASTLSHRTNPACTSSNGWSKASVTARSLLTERAIDR